MSFRAYSLLVVLYNLGVILWGAYVRATGSGAGCGDHWPMCNGVVIPRAPSAQTAIEFTHRLTSGLALLSVLALLIWAFRRFEKGHRVRKGAAWTMGFMLSEAAVGAGIVLFRLVAEDTSVSRAVVMCLHLVNTFLLLAAMTLTTWWASEKPSFRLQGQGAARGIVLAGTGGLLLLGITGAVAALGDTLFPATSLSHGLAQDFDSASHFLLRLRIFHPVLAVLVAIGSVVGGIALVSERRDPAVKRSALILGIIVGAQLVAGVVNLLLMAPVWMQLVHLLLADLVWIAWVVLCAEALSVEPATEPGREPTPSVQLG